MGSENIWREIGAAVRCATGEDFVVRKCHAIAGGCINSTYLIEDGARRFFVKVHGVSGLTMFEAEADGLREIMTASAIRVPEPVCVGVAEDSAFLVLEFIDFSSGTRGWAEDFGLQLSDMHRVCAPQHGWRRDNTIGSTHQVNTLSGNWPEFWRDRRLGCQLALAASKGYGDILQRNGERLLAKVDGFFTGYVPLPSLLHGDMWGGNYAYTTTGEPVIFDPATYYGDREVDLAMTELFGGFPAVFHAAYREAFPLDAGYPMRKELYNLYHILNHLNMFGAGYLGQAEEMIEALLSKAG